MNPPYGIANADQYGAEYQIDVLAFTVTPLTEMPDMSVPLLAERAWSSRSLGTTPVNPAVERYNYHRLTRVQLRELNDPEAWFELYFRTRYYDDDMDIHNLMLAAKEGHPVAIASCFMDGIGIQSDQPYGIRLLKESVKRGHAGGMCV